ncbi:MAG: hypothetical protein H6Q89_3208 [Myxococcaceae bacterium]|nr:hypothetical protein [Myxococcaceae bacterium]
MDELSELIEQLQREVAELERALRLREAEEGAKLRLEAARLKAAEARLARARQLLDSETAALAMVDQKRTHLLARIDGWQGQLWRIGYGSVAMVTVPMVMTSLPLAGVWLGSSWALALGAGQAALFAVLYLLIPEKR